MQIKKRLREITASCLFFVLWVILSCCFVAKSYAGIVTGRVTDSETGETLIGATVSYAEGAGALTDVDGHYSIEVPEGKQTLTVRYVGYRPEVRELTIGRDPLVLDVSLTPDNAVLQDVVVLSQLDNLKVVKSAAPDYPADFTGGFILLQTKDGQPVQ